MSGRCIAVFAGLLLPLCVQAADFSLPGVHLHLEDVANQDLSSPVKILILLTALSLVPSLLMLFTSFTRIVIVLALLRHALGLPSTPPNSVLIGLALFLTAFTMAPVYDQVTQDGLKPYQRGEISVQQFGEVVESHVRGFMVRQTREKDIHFVMTIRHADSDVQSIDDVDLVSLSTAFLLSELHTAFKIGFFIFLPFLLIDLLVSSILMAMGMIMLPPLTISLPIKLLLFVLVEGWQLVIGALIGSFR